MTSDDAYDRRPPPPAARSPRDPWLFAGLLLVVALVPRLYVALAWGAEAVWDGHYYDFGARRIAEGHGYSDDLTIAGQLVWHPWCHYPVGYSAFLGLFYKLFGATARVAAVVNASTGAALALVTYGLARHGLSETRARIAGVLIALHPGLILYAALVMTEPLAATLTLLAFLLTVRDRNTVRGVAVGAIVLGIAALVRPQAILCAPLLGLLPGLHRGLRLPRSIALAALACALTLAPVLPWTARNCRVMDGCALVSTNAGWNLAIGAFPRATGRFETLRSSDGCREVTGQVQQDRCWFNYGVEQIKTHTAFWLSLVPAKLSFTFDHESFAVEYLREARPAAWPEERRLEARGLATLAHRLLVGAAAFGCVAFAWGRRRDDEGPREPGALLAQTCVLVSAAVLAYVAVSRPAPTFWPLAVFAATVPWIPLPGRATWRPALWLPVALLLSVIVTHAVFFGEDRYHVVVTPVFALLAAAAFRRSAS